MTADCPMVTSSIRENSKSRTCQEHVVNTNCFECLNKKYENFTKVSMYSLGIAELNKILSEAI